jgi:hypothetical protein
MSDERSAAELARGEAIKQGIGLVFLVGAVVAASWAERALSGPDVARTARMWWCREQEAFCARQAVWWQHRAVAAQERYIKAAGL